VARLALADALSPQALSVEQTLQQAAGDCGASVADVVGPVPRRRNG